MKSIRRMVWFIVLYGCSSVYAWNAVGHRLVAQIAYNHLTSHARHLCNRYNHSLDGVFRPLSFVKAAPWMDWLRYSEDLWLKPMHYIDIPFTVDNSPVEEPEKLNAVSAIEIAKAVILDKNETDYNKGFSLRILLHVVGDLHQPLHAANLFSAKYPKGDLGGNLYQLGTNPIGKNLHSYWDKGGGMLIASKKDNKNKWSNKARQLANQWSCDQESTSFDPKEWSAESHQIAVMQAYSINAGNTPSKEYQTMTQQISEKRIFLAGCRLAALLNSFA